MRDQTMKIPQAEENIRDQQCPESLGKTRNVQRVAWTSLTTLSLCKPQLRPPTPLSSIKSVAIKRDILRLTLTNFISEHFNDEFE